MARELLLEIVDFLVGAHPVGFRAVALDSLHQHPSVPGAVEDGEASPPRQVAPEPPHIGLGALLVGGRGDGDDLVHPGFQGLGDAPDAATLACCVVAFKYCQDGELFEIGMAGEQIELALVLLQLRQIGLFVQFLGEVEGSQHVHAVDDGGEWRGLGDGDLLGLLLQPLLQGFQQDFTHHQAAVAGVRPLYDGPGGLAGAAVADDLLRDLAEAVIELEVLPVPLRDTPAGLGVAFQGLQALFLLVLGEVEPELEQQRAFIRQHALETHDAVQGLAQFRVPGRVEHALEQGVRIPGAEKDADPPLGGEHAPEPPHRRTFAFLVGGLAHAVGADVAGIHPFVQQVGGLAAARAIHAAHEDDDREARLLEEVHLCFQQGFPQDGHFLGVGFLIDFVAEFR